MKLFSKHNVLMAAMAAMVMLGLGSLASCSEDDGEGDNEYVNWQQRNEDYMMAVRRLALDSIAMAKEQYGDNWEKHCNWRAFRSYSIASDASATWADSVIVQVLKRSRLEGDASAKRDTVYVNDSVRLFYRGRLIPSASYPEGRVFDHSGQSSIYEEIFDETISVPTTMRVSSFVKGFGTALLYMRPGERWRMYIPSRIGYGDRADKTSLPPYSTLIFETQLVAFYRYGTAVPPWK